MKPKHDARTVNSFDVFNVNMHGEEWNMEGKFTRIINLYEMQHIPGKTSAAVHFQRQPPLLSNFYGWRLPSPLHAHTENFLNWPVAVPHPAMAAWQITVCRMRGSSLHAMVITHYVGQLSLCV